MSALALNVNGEAFDARIVVARARDHVGVPEPEAAKLSALDSDV